MMDAYRDVGSAANIIAVEEVPIERVHMYGVVGVGEPSGKAFEITEMVEKPSRDDAPSNLIITGRYILQPEIFGILANQDARRRRRDPADRRHDPPGAGRSRSTASSSRARASTAARRSAFSPPMSPMRWRATTSRPAFRAELKRS